MKKQAVLLLALVFSLSFMSFISAEMPPNPIQFYGEVTYNNGTGIPSGYYLTAKIGTTISGQCIIVNSLYNCKVYIPQSSPIRCEDPKECSVNFLLGENMTIGNGRASEFDSIELNLNVSSLPERNLTKISDGKCSPNECFYNIVDCDASKTSLCSGNGRCDIEIGETCTFNPTDCGACSTGSSTSGSSGGTNGGSSGGGGGGSSKPKNTTNTGVITLSQDNTTNTDSNLTGNENTLNENQEGTNIFRITGLAITDFVKTPAGKGVLIFIVLLVVFAVLFYFSKNMKRNSGQKNFKITKLSDMNKDSNKKTA